MPWISNPKNTVDIIKKYNFTLSKKYGQNFLIDSNILDMIVAAADIKEDDTVLEIGPGLGSLTQRLASKAKKVVAIEIDKLLIPILNETLSEYNNIVVLNEDILKTDIGEIIDKYAEAGSIKVVANLPYYITTPIVMKLLEGHYPVESITVMVQKEVAERMQAVAGSKDYGALSIAVAYYCAVYMVGVISPNCFIPKPKVESAVIKLVLGEKCLKAVDEKMLFKIIRASFNQRRKTLQNGLLNSPELNLNKESIVQVFKEMGLERNIRGETLELRDFIELADKLLIKESGELSFGKNNKINKKE
ncbi:dimethyladenosine transferase [Johnsonella ignava ATCC 51276]|uniref:Ribosomal RNA small subunit methyltransferase A n=1 Tax=Johnsonella ignava ATCC 51276 TaxID=679200 RepID=G5GJB3_9FIRM|nr:16S rRNA (adenine(1518)-N(6)/adenine(1519)-N(6))-dimethyltransferase RsmA [Johnsonella ignava]EHI55238.1 dimethyladenosine transferase [Johnsonella ignava ATCC 51276]